MMTISTKIENPRIIIFQTASSERHVTSVYTRFPKLFSYFDVKRRKKREFVFDVKKDGSKLCNKLKNVLPKFGFFFLFSYPEKHQSEKN
jgi:hypothetical protein